MSTRKRKERERRQRQAKILETATELISEKGFEKITMDEIAERSELSKGTLYLYFNNKSTLYQAIRKEALEKLQEQFMATLQQDIPGAMLVRNMSKDFLRLIDENPVYAQSLAFYEVEKSSDKSVNACVQLEQELLMLITRALQIGIQDGSIQSSLKPKILAIQIGLMMKGVMQFCITKTGGSIAEILKKNKVSISTVMQQFMDTLLHQVDLDTRIKTKS